MRSWTVDEANTALPRVTVVVERMRRAASEVVQARDEAAERASGNGQRERLEIVPELEQAVDELQEDGIVVRDIEAGLVDFPALSPTGRPYWLCWVLGEPEVAWWHWPEDGFPGRAPISTPPE